MSFSSYMKDGLKVWCGLDEREGETHVAPDGHNQDHGQGERIVEHGIAANLAEAVEIVEGDGRRLAELGVDGVGVGGDALDVGGRHLDGGAILDEDLVHAVGLESSDNAVYC